MVLSLSADTSSGSDVLFPERRIVFHQGKDNIIVGRASKVSMKGYVAGIENAWFHSPVMSRHHAQIFARMDCNVRSLCASSKYSRPANSGLES